MKTFSLLFAWSDNDQEQGEYGTIVRAADYEEAEAKGRADMRENHISNHCDADADADEIAESCAEYENTDWRGNVTFGGRMIECHEGAIWKAAELEKALRAVLATNPLPDDLRHVPDETCSAYDAAQALIAEIDGIDAA